jgi:hypothetical protein
MNISHIISCYTKSAQIPFGAGRGGGREWENRRGQQQLASQQRPGEARAARTKQQKPLTLYGIGLINQIMDFTLFLRSLARLSALARLSSSSFPRFDFLARHLSRILRRVPLAVTHRRQHEIRNETHEFVLGSRARAAQEHEIVTIRHIDFRSRDSPANAFIARFSL